MVFPVSRLEAKRREKFMSQWDLARATNIIQTRLSLIERGEVKPKPKEIEAISKVLGIGADQIFPDDFQTSRVSQVERLARL